jgi:hypothetical protein
MEVRKWKSLIPDSWGNKKPSPFIDQDIENPPYPQLVNGKHPPSPLRN